ncbi:hypothetical protein ELS19_14450, partial [Halogeometricum borinquense]
MGATFLLVVPNEEQTLETGKTVYQYHVENSKYDDTLADLPPYQYFKNDLQQDGTFMIYEKPTTSVVDAGEPSMQEIQYKYEDDDHVV